MISSSEPLVLVDLLQPTSDRHTAIAIPGTDIRVTYGSLRSQIESLAEALTTAGVARGDRVGIALPNGVAAVVCFLAASVAGTAAPLNPAYTEEEFRFYLNDTGARTLIVPPDGAEAARKAAGDRIRILTAEAASTGIVQLSGTSGRASISIPSKDDVALVLHTSGSTGRPKRVPLTHANLSISARNIARWYKLGPDDVSLCVMPLFHVHGLVASMLATLATGGTLVVPPKFNPLSFWRVARDHGVTWFSAVPTLHQLLLARRGAGRPSGSEKLRFIRSCSASLPPRVMHEMEESFGAPVLEAYGMTEAAHQIASNPLPPSEHKAGSVGCGADVSVGIMDEEGHLLPAGQRGEVVIKGPNVILGYENNPEANVQSFFDGWFRTGDEGFLDRDGYLTLVARIKELINRGGEKFAPREIDEVLLAHPAVAEAATFGVPHATWGEEVAAAVVLRDTATEEELIAHCRERLADFKCPKRIHITDKIPRTATGKIQRRMVAEAYSQDAS